LFKALKVENRVSPIHCNTLNTFICLHQSFAVRCHQTSCSIQLSYLTTRRDCIR